ncbi:hypothetical protein SNE40_021363 [Patella caerulea]|uniref:3-oxoacyl-[acyl-carrier-protein] reductase n=1 Tax=Patella caerulea TaxID=87958 RepID=A0AAN8J0J2_PATCE
MDLSGKVAVVSGSTTGIGLGISHHLASKGCSVVITGLGSQDLTDSVLKDFRGKYKGRYEYVEGDLRKEDCVISLCDKVLQLFPDGVDILINNAGIIHISDVEDYPVQKWNDMVSVSLTAPFIFMRQFIPKMKIKGWGRIISMSSQMGHVSAPGQATYSAVKSGLIGLTKGVALEVATHGVTVNAICPGFADAPMFHTFVKVDAVEKKKSYEDTKVQYSSQIPTNQLVTIDQIGEMVLYLCSPGACNVTGTSLLIDGGYTAR